MASDTVEVRKTRSSARPSKSELPSGSTVPSTTATASKRRGKRSANSDAREEPLEQENDVQSIPEESDAKSIEQALPEIPPHLSFCFLTVNNSNRKEIKRCCWPKILLRLDPEDQSPGQKMLLKFFKHLYTGKEDKIDIDFVPRPVHRDAEDEDEEGVTKEDIPYGLYVQALPTDEVMQYVEVNLNPPKTYSKKSKVSTASVGEEEKQNRDEISILGRLKRQFLSGLNPPMKPLHVKQKEFVDLCLSMDFTDRNARHPPTLLYQCMGSGKTPTIVMGLMPPPVAGAAKPWVPPEEVLIVLELTVIEQFVPYFMQWPQFNGHTRYEIVGYDEFRAQLIKRNNPDYVKGRVLVIDEAHYYRCATEKMIPDMKSHRQAQWKVLLTGTPLQNLIDDQYALNMQMGFAPIQVLTFHSSEEMTDAERAAAKKGVNKRAEGIRHQVKQGTYEWGLMDEHGNLDPIKLIELQKKYDGRVSYYAAVTERERAINADVVVREDKYVPLTWRQTLQYFLKHRKNVEIGGWEFQSGIKNNFEVNTRLVSMAMRDPEDEKRTKKTNQLLDAPKLDAMANWILHEAFDLPVACYLEFRECGVDELRIRIYKQFEECVRKGICKSCTALKNLIVDEITASVTPQQRAVVRERVNNGKVHAFLFSPAAKEALDLKNVCIFMHGTIAKSKGEESQVEDRIRLYNAGSRPMKPNVRPHVLRWITRFPDLNESPPSEEELKRMELDFRILLGNHYPEDKPLDFDLLQSLQKFIEEQNANGGTCEQRAVIRNENKAQLLKPALLMLQASSNGWFDQEIRYRWSQYVVQNMDIWSHPSHANPLEKLNGSLADHYVQVDEYWSTDRSKMWSAQCKKTGKKVVIKSVCLGSVEQDGAAKFAERVARVGREWSIRRMFSATAGFPVFLRMCRLLNDKSASTSGHWVHFVSEEIAGKPLSQWIDRSKRQTPFSVPEALDVFRQICEFLRILKYFDFIHGDLSSPSLFVDRGVSGKCKPKVVLADVEWTMRRADYVKLGNAITFGSSTYHSPEVSAKTHLPGPQGWGEGHSIAPPGRWPWDRDAWAASVVLFECLTGSVPFSANNIADLRKSVMEGLDESKERQVSETITAWREQEKAKQKSRIAVSAVACASPSAEEVKMDQSDSVSDSSNQESESIGVSEEGQEKQETIKAEWITSLLKLHRSDDLADPDALLAELDRAITLPSASPLVLKPMDCALLSSVNKRACSGKKYTN